MSSKSGSSRSSSSSSAIAPEQLIALPSLSSALSTLPQAKSLDGVALHPNYMSAQRAAESEAKLRKVLSKTASHPSAAYIPPVTTQSSQYSPDALTMRKPLKQKMNV
ncbi:hypothetical protein PHLGIDRAFT_20078 [Phlebiopsis gigantea 11061_1 CR5-6]|uniref:Uncharacterized protein n=1 Tax=Phlebiopsis gigantea (strain 11061_1 CR5-6) TaxID=745531 RepID=A0A0C3S2Y3_PHLG1|nr:hypothetical protein PHLGIDRAFT_20078 [Phlebiopsis gigantea 11061_1 CR5-6]